MRLQESVSPLAAIGLRNVELSRSCRPIRSVPHCKDECEAANNRLAALTIILLCTLRGLAGAGLGAANLLAPHVVTTDASGFFNITDDYV